VPSANNIHANLIAIDGEGVLITGPSGSGKTLLSLHLIRRCHHADIDVNLVADDQVLLATRDGQLIGSAPDTTRGKIEIRGMGIVQTPPFEYQEILISLHIVLTSQTAMMRMWDGRKISIAGVPIDTLALGSDNIEAAGNAALAKLGHPIWV